MTPPPLLSTSPLPRFGQEVQEATPEALTTAPGLLVPHDGGPVADVRERPDRWALLGLISGAVRRGVPVLGWGTGAALVGRVLGARVRVQPLPGLADEWAEAPRNAEVLTWRGEVPLLWRAGKVTAWAGVELPEEVRAAFLAELEAHTPPLPATPLEALGGEAALRSLLADFYDRARRDEVLGPVFSTHVTDWEAHLDRVTAFWITMLSGVPAWRGNLNAVHAGLGVRREHLERWLTLFRASAEAHLSPEAAARLAERAEAMGARLGRQKMNERQEQPGGNRPHAGRVP